MIAALLAAAGDSTEITGTVVTALLSGGGVAAIVAAAKAIKEFRQGSRKFQTDAVADLEKWRRDSDDAREAEAARADWEALMGRYWRDWAGTCEHQIRVGQGSDALPTQPPLPVRPYPALKAVASNDQPR